MGTCNCPPQSTFIETNTTLSMDARMYLRAWDSASKRCILTTYTANLCPSTKSGFNTHKIQLKKCVLLAPGALDKLQLIWIDYAYSHLSTQWIFILFTHIRVPDCEIISFKPIWFLLPIKYTASSSTLVSGDSYPRFLVITHREVYSTRVK